MISGNDPYAGLRSDRSAFIDGYCVSFLDFSASNDQLYITGNSLRGAPIDIGPCI